LAELESSGLSGLPAGFDRLTQLFSATAIIEISVPEMAESSSEIGDFLNVSFEESDELSVEAIGFEFYPTKNRSIIEMMYTSDDPENIQKLANEFALDLNIQLDYENMRFDIYEDIYNGIVLAVPEGASLWFNPEEEAFQVENTDENGTSLFFYGMKSDFSETDFEELIISMGDIINEDFALRYGMSGFTIDEEYSYWDEFEGNRKVAWILSLGNENLITEDGLEYALYMYMTLLMAEEKTFLSIATIPIPVDLVEMVMTYGLDCHNPGLNGEYCRYFNHVFQTFAAAHLTSFAY
jgi:hypothetical protein